jgi:cytochrome c556
MNDKNLAFFACALVSFGLGRLRQVARIPQCSPTLASAATICLSCRRVFKPESQKGLSMKKPSSMLTMMGAVLALLVLSACGPGGGEPADADTPEGQAFQFRQAVMRVVANKMVTIGGMAREEIPLDEAVFTKATADLAVLAGMLTEGFMPEGIPTGSNALPEVWSNWADFEQKAADFSNAAAGLAAAAESGGFASAQGLVQGTAGTCGGCHRTYRARAQDE